MSSIKSRNRRAVADRPSVSGRSFEPLATRERCGGERLASPRELHAFLRLMSEAMRGAGFDRALEACGQVGGIISVEDGVAIFEIGAAALRALGSTIRFVDKPDITQVAAQIFPALWCNPTKQ
jgi:hypothetical protein